MHGLGAFGWSWLPQVVRQHTQNVKDSASWRHNERKILRYKSQTECFVEIAPEESSDGGVEMRDVFAL